jgi:hypothetical protein
MIRPSCFLSTLVLCALFSLCDGCSSAANYAYSGSSFGAFEIPRLTCKPIRQRTENWLPGQQIQPSHNQFRFSPQRSQLPIRNAYCGCVSYAASKIQRNGRNPQVVDHESLQNYFVRERLSSSMTLPRLAGLLGSFLQISSLSGKSRKSKITPSNCPFGF